MSRHPRSNSGYFRALLAFNAAGRNDYTSGLTVDLGASGSAGFSFLNIEGVGFGGVRNLLTNAFPFGTFHRISIGSSVTEGDIRLAIDGLPQDRRPRTSPALSMQELTVGARCFSNTSEPPHTQGQFDGDIAEILIFNRAVSLAEWKVIDTYLAEKYASLRAPNENVPGGPRMLQLVDSPPPVQMFVPGFTVRELPLSLKNINDIKYRPDGKAVALGYDGRIYLLSDTDGDGLEDKADLFWDRETLRAPIGMALTPPNYARGEGIFVAAKGKLSLIIDRDRDGRADEEIIVASGWKELGHGVDALGVAIDSQNNIYFGLGCANFTDAYLLDRSTGTPNTA